MAALETAKDLPASIVDRVLSFATKQRTKSFSVARTARASLTAAQSRESRKRSLHSRVSPLDDALSKYDLPKRTTFGNPILDGYTQDVISARWKPRTGSSKSMAYQRALSEQLALNGGKMTDEIALQAVHAAETATFQDKGRWQNSPRAQSRTFKKYPKVAAAVEVIAPFTRTPANVVSRVAEYSPLGFLKSANDMVSMVRGSGQTGPGRDALTPEGRLRNRW
jgi:hypothetical protein